jgi:SPP1 gp7 family putative phage head morphogenesis protein
LSFKRLDRRPKTARAEQQYFAGLRSIADHVARMIRSYPSIETEGAAELTSLLYEYAKALKPWAKRHALKMLMDVNGRDIDTWRALSGALGQQLRFDIRNTPVGHLFAERMAEQVDLITSLPTKAAQRVVKLTQEALVNGVRSTDLIDEVMRSGEVTFNRAKLIARTEVATTASVLQEARARQAGSTHYTWETAGDADVRPGHRVMQGQVCSWDNPPLVNENGRMMRHHPGRIWNCRCWPAAIIPEL